MKISLVNGSPHEKCCIYTALNEMAETLNHEGIEMEIFQIGTKPLAGYIACKSCARIGQCVFDDKVNEFLEMQRSWNKSRYCFPRKGKNYIHKFHSVKEVLFYDDYRSKWKI